MLKYEANSCYTDTLLTILFKSTSSFWRDRIFSRTYSVEDFDLLRCKDHYKVPEQVLDYSIKIRNELVGLYATIMKGNNIFCSRLRPMFNECLGDLQVNGQWITYSPNIIYGLLADLYPDIKLISKYELLIENYNEVHSQEVAYFAMTEFMEVFEDKVIRWDLMDNEVLVFHNTGAPIIRYDKIGIERNEIKYDNTNVISEVNKVNAFGEYILDGRYMLIGVITLQGYILGQEGGIHYVGFYKNRSGRWIYYNDTKDTERELDALPHEGVFRYMNQNLPYMYFYQLINNLSDKNENLSKNFVQGVPESKFPPTIPMTALVAQPLLQPLPISSLSAFYTPRAQEIAPQSSLYQAFSKALTTPKSSPYVPPVTINQPPQIVPQTSLYVPPIQPVTQTSLFSQTPLYSKPVQTIPQTSLYVPPIQTIPQASLYVPPIQTIPQTSLYVPPIQTIPQTSLFSQPIQTIPQTSLFSQPTQLVPQTSLYVPPIQTIPQTSLYVPPIQTIPQTSLFSQTPLYSKPLQPVLQTSLYVPPIQTIPQTSLYVPPIQTIPQTSLFSQTPLYSKPLQATTLSSQPIQQIPQTSLFSQPTQLVPQTSLFSQTPLYSKPLRPVPQTSLFSQPTQLVPQTSLFSQPTQLVPQTSLFSQPTQLVPQTSLYAPPLIQPVTNTSTSLLNTGSMVPQPSLQGMYLQSSQLNYSQSSARRTLVEDLPTRPLPPLPSSIENRRPINLGDDGLIKLPAGNTMVVYRPEQPIIIKPYESLSYKHDIGHNRAEILNRIDIRKLIKGKKSAQNDGYGLDELQTFARELGIKINQSKDDLVDVIKDLKMLQGNR